MQKKMDDHIGTMYLLRYEDIAAVEVDLGDEVVMTSSWVVRSRGSCRYRSWYLISDKAMVVFQGDPTEQESLELCERWLAEHGYECRDDEPPGCFEYYRRPGAPNYRERSAAVQGSS